MKALCLALLLLPLAALSKPAAKNIEGLTLLNARRSVDAAGLNFGPAELRFTDWSPWESLALEIENPSEHELHASAVLHSTPGSWDHSAGFNITIEPKAKLTWRLAIFPLPYTDRWEFPLQKGVSKAGGWGHMDVSKVMELHLSADGEGKDALILKTMRLEGRATHHAWIDAWGQNSKGSWPGKVAKDEDLLAADARELEALKKIKTAERGKYQGWLAGPALKATGFFRTEKLKGRWWLVTPDGQPYFMTGIDCIGPGAHGHNDAAVRDAYSWLPPKEGPFAAAWWMGEGKEGVFSLYRCNLIRKWGKDFEARFQERMLERMRAWGFSSFGNWSDEKVTASHALPYVTMGPETWSDKVPFASKHLQDPFHPKFMPEARRAAKELALKTKDDPWLIGNFVGNEMDWKALPAETLEKDSSLPAKKRFVEALKKKYGEITKLNAAWHKEFKGWDEIRLPKERDAKPLSPDAEADAAAFRGEFAEAWFAGWETALKEADPNHLFLGSRIHGGGNRSAEVIAACGRHCDVVSYNEYSLAPEKADYDKWQALADKPFIVGEYTFNSLDDGLLASAVPVADRVQRGVGYRYYTEQMAALPYFVGGHYFQYIDEPITGRGDRETSYNGFVRVTDIPDDNLVAAAVVSNRLVEDLHAGLKKPVSLKPKRF